MAHIREVLEEQEREAFCGPSDKEVTGGEDTKTEYRGWENRREDAKARTYTKIGAGEWQGSGGSDAISSCAGAKTDGSENSVKAAELAFRIAQASGARVTLIYVIDSGVISKITRFARHQEAEVRQEVSYRNGNHYLDFLETLAQRAHLPVKREVREGVPYEREIVDAAGSLGVDLITSWATWGTAARAGS